MPPEQRAILDRWEANKIAELGKLTFLITGYLEGGLNIFGHRRAKSIFGNGRALYIFCHEGP